MPVSNKVLIGGAICVVIIAIMIIITIMYPTTDVRDSTGPKCFKGAFCTGEPITPASVGDVVCGGATPAFPSGQQYTCKLYGTDAAWLASDQACTNDMYGRCPV